MTALLLAGCASGGQAKDQPPAPTTIQQETWPSAAPAPSAGRVGSPDLCPMPVAFDTAEGWEPIDKAQGGAIAGLLPTCQIINTREGTLTVYVGDQPGSQPAPVLDAFLKGVPGSGGVKTRETTVGMGTGVEAFIPETGERAFAVTTPLRAVVVLFTPTEDGAVAAFALAKSSLTPVER